MIKHLHFTNRFRRTKDYGTLLFFLVFFTIGTGGLFHAEAQSTTSSISGFVKDGNGAVADAVVVAYHAPTNTSYYSISNSKGYYVFNNVLVGGPYSIKIEKMGYKSTTIQNINAPLSENVVVNVTLEKSSVSLDEVTIQNPDASTMNIQRSGVSTRITQHTMTAVPTIERSLNDIMKLTPQAANIGGGIALGGGNYRGSAVSVDGATFNNSFGIGSNLPAGGAPISLDAIEQIGINLSPYNVRQSGFLGGAVNMVTKRGSNEWHGSVYDYFTSSALRGQKVDTNMLTTSSTLNNVSGLTVGGPIVKDKLFFFLNGEYIVDNEAGSTIQARPDESHEYGGSTGYNRPTVAQMDNMLSFLNDKFGYNPGRYQNYSISTPDYKVMARLDWNINKNNMFNFRVSHTHTSNSNGASSSINPLFGSSNSITALDGETYAINRYVAGRQSYYAMLFESSRYFQDMNFTSVAAELNSNVLGGRGNNMARITWSLQNEPRSFVGDIFPTVDILEPYTAADGSQQMAFFTTFGPDPFTYANLRKVNTLTATDEFTYTKGIHNILAGAQFEWNMIQNGFMQGGAGWYVYDSWQSFVNDVNGVDGARPVAFMVTHANSDDPTEAVTPSFFYSQASVYAQDEMSFSPYFKLTAGLRLEMPFIRFPNENRNLDFDAAAAAHPESSFGGLSTADFPKLSLNVSPRIGFNWDITKNQKVVLRGGSGIFTGRIPNVWIVTAVSSSNCLQYQYIANNSTGNPVVHFDPDREDVINSIYSDGKFEKQELPAPTNGTILAKDLKLPSAWKSSLALDVTLPKDVKLTFEGLYSFGFNEVYANVLGYKEDGTIQLPGEPEGRTHYSREDVTNANGAKMSGYYLHNENGFHGQYVALTAQISKSFRFGLDLMAAYTFSRSVSLTDGIGDQVSSFANISNRSDVNSPELGFSGFVSPHRLIAAVGYTIKEGKHTATKLGLFYEGMNLGIYNGYTVARYSYLMNNVSGIGNNQLIYIPTTDELEQMPFVSADNKADFEDFIVNDPYLSKHRGEYSKRNGGKAPWLNRINFKISQEFYFNVDKHKQTLDVGLDINNLGNLFSSKWGTYKSLNNDVVLNYKNGTYTFTAPVWSTYNNLLSTWQILLHLRYAF